MRERSSRLSPAGIGHTMDPIHLSNAIKHEAWRLGFDPVGITGPEPPESAPQFLDWIRKGYHGEMLYLEQRAQQRLDLRSVFPPVRSVIVVGMNYAPDPTTAPAGKGRVSCYAWGKDYHIVMRSRMKHLLARVREQTGVSFAARICVDTAPVLERDLARRAGLGWIGKNTCLVNRNLGTWLFLGVIPTNLDLPPDTPQKDRCGTCRKCLDACPTGALIAPRILDARKCISALTIECRTSIPTELKPSIGNHLFGCDECLSVCPWNRFSRPTREPSFQPINRDILFDPPFFLNVGESEFRKRFQNTPPARTGRAALARNAAIVLDNLRKKESTA